MLSPDPAFADRHDVGRQLAVALRGYKEAQPLILALPRGGVPVGYEVARELDATLDVVFVRKIGAPGHRELGLGAVVDGPDPLIVLNQSVMQEVRPSPDYVEAEARRELAEIERRRAVYRGGQSPEPLENRTVIVVDDGIATGGTVRAVLQALRRAGASRLIVAVSVAPRDTVEALKQEADEVVCLFTSEPFCAVCLHYNDFKLTSDEVVIDLLALVFCLRKWE